VTFSRMAFRYHDAHGRHLRTVTAGVQFVRHRSGALAPLCKGGNNYGQGEEPGCHPNNTGGPS
jgi:hypothetical protein